MVAIPIVLVGALAGLAFSGIIEVPGISPAKKKAKAAADYAETKDPNDQMALKKPAAKPPTEAEDAPAEPTAEVTAAVTEVKPELGAKKLGSLWNEVEATSLGEIVENWKDEDLSKVLVKM